MNELIVACENCGQQNRIPSHVAPGKVVICGRCKEPFDLDDIDDDDSDGA